MSNKLTAEEIRKAVDFLKANPIPPDKIDWWLTEKCAEIKRRMDDYKPEIKLGEYNDRRC
jgi:hypothetical protein